MLIVMNKEKIKKISTFLKITGIIAIAIGLILEFTDLKGCLIDKQRIEILNWALNSDSGMSIELPAAKKFMKNFPPPENEKKENLTHLTKSVMQYEIGGILNASVNYMRKDTSRTSHIATLEEIRKWANETPYPWISWWITLFGFIGLIGNFIIEKKLEDS